MRRLTLPARLALLSMLAVTLAVSAALYAAWLTTDARLTAEIDSDLSTQVREWDRLAAQQPPRDAVAFAATARAWVREQQQDHPSRQLQVVVLDSQPAGSDPQLPELVGNTAWGVAAARNDMAPLLASAGSPGPTDVQLADGTDYRVVTRHVTTGRGATAHRLGQVVVADSIDVIATARDQLARDTLLIGTLAMGLAALLVGGGSALITRQLRRLGQVAAAAGDGDLGVRAGRLRGAPEVRDLARVLDDSLDRIEHAMASQKAFVADASHELRTPLAVIRAQAELIGAEHDPARREEDIADLLRQTDTTRRLVDDLLTIATGDAAPASLVVPRDIDLLDHAQDLRRDLPLLGERRFEVHAVPGTLTADPDRVDQIVRNLVANAVAHTPRDGLVQVRFEAADAPGRLRIVVRDNGVGMAPELVAHAFERFTRGRRQPLSQGRDAAAEKTTQPEPGAGVGGSAGLGLPLVRTLAQAHGGTATLSSAPGQGTTVRVELPGYRATGSAT